MTTSSSRAQRSDLDVAVTTAEELRHGPNVERLPALVLGGSGYVGGELLRLLAGHPGLRPAVVVSDSKPGVAVEEVFPHLAGALGGLTFSGRDALPRILGEHPRLAVFGAAPHGAAAPMMAELFDAATSAGSDVAVVDMSADFRFADAAAWERVYGHPHRAPALLAGFFCAVPELAPTAELARGVPARAIAHPGCFTTATLLAAVPLLRAGLVEPDVTVVAVTGSTGAGRTPTATTHHPERRSTLFAYSPLQHRHQPEMEALAAAAGAPASFHFVPQAGPFARGIHATLVMRPTNRRHRRRRARRARELLRRRALRRRPRGAAAAAGGGGDEPLPSRRGRRRRDAGGVLGARQPGQGRRRGRHAVDEPAAGLPRDGGPADARPGLAVNGWP